MELFLTIATALFSVINPLGTVPVFVALTKEDLPHHRNKTALWTALNVLFIMLIAFFAGKYVLSFFGVSLNSLRLAGGLVIATSGFALLSGSFSKHKGMKRASVKADIHTRSEVSLTPLAIPMLAGPGSISLLITFQQTYGKNVHSYIIAVSAMLFVCLLVFVILRTSPLIVKYLGASGLNSISRIIGFIVIAIGVEYISISLLNFGNDFLVQIKQPH